MSLLFEEIKEKEIRTLTQSEIQQLVSNSSNLEMIALIIGLNTGLDLLELLNIKKSDIDFSSCTIFVQSSKMPMGRTIYLPPSAIQRLKPAVSILNGGISNLFQHSPYTFETNILQKWSKQVGFPVKWKTIRHTYSSLAAQKGCPVKLVAHNIGVKEFQLDSDYMLNPSLISDILKDKVIM